MSNPRHTPRVTYRVPAADRELIARLAALYTERRGRAWTATDVVLLAVRRLAEADLPTPRRRKTK